MQIETRNKILAGTIVALLPLAAATIARIITHNPEVETNAFYITTLVDFVGFGAAAKIARRRAGIR